MAKKNFLILLFFIFTTNLFAQEYWSNKKPEDFGSAEVIISPANATFIVEQLEKLP